MKQFLDNDVLEGLGVKIEKNNAQRANGGSLNSVVEQSKNEEILGGTYLFKIVGREPLLDLYYQDRDEKELLIKPGIRWTEGTLDTVIERYVPEETTTERYREFRRRNDLEKRKQEETRQRLVESKVELDKMEGGVGIEPLEHPDDIIRSWWMQPMGKDRTIVRWDLVYSENGKEIRRTEGVQGGDITYIVKKYDPEARKYFFDW